MMHHCFFNGVTVPKSEAHWHLNDLGLLRGYGCFEYFRTYNGKIFRPDDYLNRLHNSAALLQIELPLSRTDILDVLQDLYQRAGQADIFFRLIVTGGVSDNSLTSNKASIAIMTEDGPAGTLKSIRAMTQNYLREMPSVKSTNYTNLILRQKEFAARNVQDVLYIYNGQVLEFSRSNIFLVKNQTLITPKNNILHGITRRSVLDIAQAHFQTEERDVSMDELWNADEVFLTASGTRIAAVTHFDDRAIGDGVIGPATQKISALFDRFTAQS